MKKSDVHKIIKEVYQEILEEEKLKEGILSWVSGVARNMAYGIIDKRAGYMSQAIKYDPKLQKLAKDLNMDNAAFEKRVNDLLGRDPDFLKALSTASYKRRR